MKSKGTLKSKETHNSKLRRSGLFSERVVQVWPEPIRRRCLSPQRLDLESLLKNANNFISDHIGPTIALELAKNKAVFALYTTKFILMYRAYFLMLLGLALKKSRSGQQALGTFQWLGVLRPVLPAGLSQKFDNWASQAREEGQLKQHKQLYLSQPMQIARDQEFFNDVVRPRDQSSPDVHSQTDGQSPSNVHSSSNVQPPMASSPPEAGGPTQPRETRATTSIPFTTW